MIAESEIAESETPSVERANSWLQSGRHAAAYADALALLARQPESGAVIDLLVRAAACAERQDETADALQEFGHRMDRVDFARAQVSLSLLAGDLDRARAVADGLASVPEASAAHLDMMIAIAQRDYRPETTLTWMRERERRVPQVPFAWLPPRWQEQNQLGQQAEVIQETTHLEQTIPAHFVAERRTVRLNRAMATHNALRFDESAACALGLVADLVEARVWPGTATSAVRLGTRCRQGIVAAAIERHVLTQELPVALHAGTLLGLVRDGDFFPSDQDMDLAVTPPATSAAVVQALTASGAFRIHRQALDTGAFRSLVHVRTGLAIDVTEYHREGDRFISTWRHPSGVSLRQAAVPAFSVRLTDHAGVGRRLPLPDAPDEQLRATYGDWETPNADFDTMVSAPNILEFTDFLRSVAAIRLADAILSGRNGQARHLARSLLARSIAPDLMTRIADGHPGAS